MSRESHIYPIPRGFELITTEDGSPTLHFEPNEEGAPESMHNRRGALSESLYIYHEAMSFVTQKHWPLSVLSVGLGLGYNELILSAHLVRLGALPSHSAYLESFEREDWLRESFVRWVLDEFPSQAASPWKATYETILKMVSRQFEVKDQDVKEQLQQMHQRGQWKVRGELEKETSFSRPFSCILYDAYSSHTNPELWDQGLLEELIKKAADKNCAFATYARTGNLNRALRENGFLIEERAGFKGKRHSTFAIKLTPRRDFSLSD